MPLALALAPRQSTGRSSFCFEDKRTAPERLPARALTMAFIWPLDSSANLFTETNLFGMAVQRIDTKLLSWKRSAGLLMSLRNSPS